MTYSNYIRVILLMLLTFFGLTSCKKYLDKKPLQSLYVPSTLNDLQALLDNNNLMNNQSSPSIMEVVADNYYVTTTTWKSLSNLGERLNYIWDKNAVHENSWYQPYQNAVYYSNVVLDALPTISVKEEDEILGNNIKGAALFYRAFAFHSLAQLYCRPYSSSAGTDPGIVLRLTSNIDVKSVRATVQETYDQVIGDLKAAADLLPETTLFPTRPNKAAAYGALARVYLSMRDYVNAGQYADIYLQVYNVLLDYNTISSPISRFNSETIFFSYPTPPGILVNTRAKIDSNLYQSYDDNDLRKTLFFQPNTGANVGTYGFIGSYAESPAYRVFTGITTDEMYLIRAESSARVGLKDSAMNDLNRLLITRWKKIDDVTTYVNMTANTSAEALQKILTERRKELVYRGLRWSDLRRLNLEGADITLTRIIDGALYTLPPNDPRWVLLMPLDVINRSGIKQNLR